MAITRYGEGTKRIAINGKQIGHATSIKGSRETSTNTTVCFDEVVTEGTKQTGFKLDIDRIIYEGKSTYREIRAILDDLLENPGIVTIEEDIAPPEEQSFTIKKVYTNCILDSDEYEIKPEEKTVSSLSIIAGAMEETITPP